MLYPGILLSRNKLFALKMKPFSGFLLLCIKFAKQLSSFGIFIVFLYVPVHKSAVLFVALNFSSSFSGEKTKNGEIAVLQIVAHVAVCIHMHLEQQN